MFTSKPKPMRAEREREHREREEEERKTLVESCQVFVTCSFCDVTIEIDM